eukprot:c20640_g1_i1.p1 GENE.c20640_g1_i1~~c20640_g1_i1.p1  ORF type:complete len:657 (-),score=123.80 c20640_g1_i1:570-2393(-)
MIEQWREIQKLSHCPSNNPTPPEPLQPEPELEEDSTPPPNRFADQPPSDLELLQLVASHAVSVINVVYIVAALTIAISMLVLFYLAIRSSFLALTGVALAYSAVLYFAAGMFLTSQGSQIIGALILTLIASVSIPVAAFSLCAHASATSDQQIQQFRSRPRTEQVSRSIDSLLNKNTIAALVAILASALAIFEKSNYFPPIQIPVYFAVSAIYAATLLRIREIRESKFLWWVFGLAFSIAAFVFAFLLPESLPLPPIARQLRTGAACTSMNFFVVSFPCLLADLLCDGKLEKLGSSPQAVLVAAVVNFSLLIWAMRSSAWICIPYALFNVVCISVVTPNLQSLNLVVGLFLVGVSHTLTNTNDLMVISVLEWLGEPVAFSALTRLGLQFMLTATGVAIAVASRSVGPARGSASLVIGGYVAAAMLSAMSINEPSVLLSSILLLGTGALWTGCLTSTESHLLKYFVAVRAAFIALAIHSNFLHLFCSCVLLTIEMNKSVDQIFVLSTLFIILASIGQSRLWMLMGVVGMYVALFTSMVQMHMSQLVRAVVLTGIGLGTLVVGIRQQTATERFFELGSGWAEKLWLGENMVEISYAEHVLGWLNIVANR